MNMFKICPNFCNIQITHTSKPDKNYILWQQLTEIQYLKGDQNCDMLVKRKIRKNQGNYHQL